MLPTPSKQKARSYANVLSAITIGMALTVLALLGTRHLTGYDLGYHLAFGETFFQTGQLVDHTPFLYTLPSLDTNPSERPEPGPGNWYDDEGQYRFPNANWLSELIMYGSWYLAGPVGLNILQLLIITILSLLLIIVMSRYKIPSYVIALALLLMGLMLDPRLTMRPELFGYVCLTTQFVMLMAVAGNEKSAPPSPLWTAGMVILQLLFVNVHSYFILGIALTGAVLTTCFLSFIWNRLVVRDREQLLADRIVVWRLTLTLIAMVLVCFINPWGWRLVFLPWQTFLFLKTNAIGGSQPVTGAHPWDFLLEFRSTLSGPWPEVLSDYGCVIVLVLAAAAFILQLIIPLGRFSAKRQAGGNDRFFNTYRVRWAFLLMIAGMVYVGLQMRRNIAVMSLIVVPASLIIITDSCRFLRGERWGRSRMRLSFLASTVIVSLSVYGCFQIVSGKLYAADKVPTFFGFGLSSTVLPLGATTWLNEHAPEAHIWSDFNCSSTVRFFTRPHKDLPILTDTWAYPPEVFAVYRDYVNQRRPFSALVDQYNIDAVVIMPAASPRLHRQLGSDPHWKIVHAEGAYVLYLHANKKYLELATRYEIRTDSFDAATFVRQQLANDPSFGRSVLSVVDTFATAGKLDLAINILERGIANYPPQDSVVWKKLFNVYNARISTRTNNDAKQTIDDMRHMKYVLEKILEFDPSDALAANKLEEINRILARISPNSAK